MKVSKITEKDKFIFSIYKSEAQGLLGSNKLGLAAIKETSWKVEGAFKCSFGLPSPWVDRSSDYTSKLIHSINYHNYAINDDTESLTSEFKTVCTDLMEHVEQKNYKSVTPLSSVILYSLLKKGT